jgi:hypothetical protein
MTADRRLASLEEFLAERGEPLLHAAILLTGSKEGGEAQPRPEAHNQLDGDGDDDLVGGPGQLPARAVGAGRESHRAKGDGGALGR